MNWEIRRESTAESTAICTADSDPADLVSGQIQTRWMSRHATKVINNQYVTVLSAVRYNFNGWCMYLYIGEGLRMGVFANITL